MDEIVLASWKDRFWAWLIDVLLISLLWHSVLVVLNMTAFGRSGILLLASSLLILRWFCGKAEVLLGVSAVLLYNGFYTYLKRVWPFAAVPGAVIGALPPFIGWTAAGGSFDDPRIFAVALFFFIWQMPHFWILLFIYGRDYERAGLPALTKVFHLKQLVRITFWGVLITAVSGLLFPFYGVISSWWICFALVACSIVLVIRSWMILREEQSGRALWKALHAINLYALCIMAFLIADALL